MATSLLTYLTITDTPLAIASGDVIAVEVVIVFDSNQQPDGNLSLIHRPTSSITFWGYPGVQCYINRDPVILDSGILLDLGGCADTVLWLDA